VGVHPAEGQGDNRIARESAEDRGGSGEAEVLARVHESPGQSRGVPSLKGEELDEVLDIELRQVQKRVLDSTTRPFLFRITSEGREFLLEEGTDQRYGAAT